MSITVIVPELGESILDATIAHWLKQEGDQVVAGEPLVELETDKVNLEVPARQSGILTRIERKEQEDVKVGDVIGVIEELEQPEAGSSPQAADKPALSQSPELAEGKVEKPVLSTVEAPTMSQSPELAEGKVVEAATSHIPELVEGKVEGPALSKVEGPALSKVEGPALSKVEGPALSKVEGPALSKVEGPALTPVAQRFAREQDIDVSRVAGTGPGGRVTKSDVENYLQKSVPAAPPKQEQAISPASSLPAPLPPVMADRPRREERIKMTRRRRTIAQRLVEVQQTAAMLTTFNEADMTQLMDLRKRRSESFQARYGVKLGITSFFVRAAIGALKAFPLLNAEVQGDEMLVKYYYDIGVAVGSPEGLVVPVLRDADRMSFAVMEAAIAEFVSRTNAGKLTLEDLRGGTFSITNGGVFGSLMSTPILTPPQVGILGLHKIEKRPVVVDERVVIRPMMYLALSYDHRIVDGREAVQFLVRVKELIEDPETLLLEG